MIYKLLNKAYKIYHQNLDQDSSFLSYLSLSLTPGIGPKTFNIIKKLYNNNLDKLWLDIKNNKQNHIPNKIFHILKNINRFEHAKKIDQALKWREDNKINHIICNTDKNYPEILKQISDAPPVLYITGNINSISSPQIAIVGSRQMSRYGQRNAKYFATELVRSGISITSGMAIGIDTTAHIYALKANGTTIAVMGTGLNNYYPRSNVKLAENIISNNGALISELPLDTSVNRINFPRRNRIISGLSIATIIIECSKKSGSLITAKYALEQSKEVFAVPGEINHPLSEGPHSLIQQGAKLVTNTQDILNELPCWVKLQRLNINNYTNTKINNKKIIQFNQLINNKKNKNSDIKSNILLYIDYEITPIDVIIYKSGIPAHTIKTELISLEMENLIKKCPGGYIKIRE